MQHNLSAAPRLSRGAALVAAFSLILAGAAVTAAAQMTTSALTGSVTGPTGIVLPGATVTIENPASGFQRVVQTDADGVYNAGELPAGTFNVQAELAGFTTVAHPGIALSPDERRTLDFELLASTSEALVVTGRATPLEREQSMVQQVIGDQLVHALPLAGRDFIAAASLTAGFSGNPTAPSAQGQTYWSNNVLVDGASHYSKWRGAPRTFYSGYGLESIREVQVMTSQFSAEYGEALAAVTLAVTNSGTNTRHGSALLFVENGALDDIPAFTPSKPPFNSARFGTTLGGPIVKDQTHFFLSYEGRRQRSKNVVVSPVAAGAEAANNEDEHLLFLKIDHRAGPRDLLTARYNGQWFGWHDEPGGLWLPGNGTKYKNNVHTLLLSDTALLNSRTLNQVRFQFSRYTDERTDLNPSLYVLRSGYSVSGGSLGPYGFGATPESTWEAADTLSHRRSAHALKIGGGIKAVSSHNEALGYGWGAYFFAGPPQLYPQPFAFVQGLAASEASATADPKSFALNAFVQDDWSAAPHLTVNMGLRYDAEKISNIQHFDSTTDRNNLQPRVGAAWEVVPGRLVVRGGVGLYTQQHLLGYINKVQLEGPDGTFMISLAPGAPLMPSYPNALSVANISVLPPRNIQVIAPDFRNPYSVQATVGTEQTIFGTIIGADVVMLDGRDLMSLVDTNAPASNRKPFERSVAQADLTRPTVPLPNGYRQILALGNQGKSWYRALQVKVERSEGPLQMIASYTLAKAQDQANYLLPEDSRNLDAEKGRSDNDIRHNLSVGGTWQVPSGGRHALANVTLSALGVFRSNRPYTISWGDDRNGTAQNDARPGNRNTAKGGTYNSVDLSLVKRFRAAGKTIDARLEGFNIFSTLNYDEYVGALNSPLFGYPVTAFPRRRIQLAAILRF